jgi:hypothetical protein
MSLHLVTTQPEIRATRRSPAEFAMSND